MQCFCDMVLQKSQFITIIIAIIIIVFMLLLLLLLLLCYDYYYTFRKSIKTLEQPMTMKSCIKLCSVTNKTFTHTHTKNVLKQRTYAHTDARTINSTVRTLTIPWLIRNRWRQLSPVLPSGAPAPSFLGPAIQCALSV